MPTYRESGVDLDAADRLVDAIASEVVSTWGPDVVGSFGGFAGGFRIPKGYEDPVLMMATDGVGTKLDLARRAGRVSGVGFDLVAMVVDDLAAAGAEPLALTDYIATGAVDVEVISELVGSVAEACRTAGVALIGGETAEHPGTLPDDSLDISAAAVGVVEGTRPLDSSAICAGDVVIGVVSPNLRSNGFSLVRAILAQGTLPPQVRGTDTLEVLLEPSVIYARAAVEARSLVRAYVHVTGGGLAGNLVRVLPEDVDALIDERRWHRPAIFDVLAEGGPVAHEEMRRVFNMGIGFVAVCEPKQVDAIASVFTGHGHDTHVIGRIIDGSGNVRYESSTQAADQPKS